MPIRMKTVGFGDTMASPGTAVGFIALGVSHALSETIGDTVAGVYLLWAPDSEVGDRVVAGSAEGAVASIELRKSRFKPDHGDVVVRANRDVETEWTRRADGRHCSVRSRTVSGIVDLTSPPRHTGVHRRLFFYGESRRKPRASARGGCQRNMKREGCHSYWERTPSVERDVGF